MARISRIVVPGIPHHITQRGNRRQLTFLIRDDYKVYLELMAMRCRRFGVEVWAYCLMPNHVHLIAVPDVGSDLCRAIGEAHQLYTRHINAREGWTGHLWQGRFASYPMDEPHLIMAARYIELNPVRAGLAREPGEYQYSSARAHLSGCDDKLVKVKPLLERIDNWRDFLNASLPQEVMEQVRKHERTGRPIGSDEFVDKLSRIVGRNLRKRKPGPKGPRKLSRVSP